jgi:TolB-like protein
VIQPSKGVFLSYASEDASVAKRICDALRVAGIEVWFDQSELRGGDAWDQKIRQQIRDCALFVPIISAHTQARPEGYFRLEWKLAVDRSHLMAAERAFLLPVVVDATTEPEALVPTQFRDVQWTRIRAGEVPAAFVDRIAALLNQPVAPHVGSPERGVTRAPAGRLPIVLTALSVAAVVALVTATAIRGGWSWHKPVPKVEASTTSAPVATTPAAIPEKSVAVLPFVDMSEKKDQEYFSDGLSEELIDMLTKVPELRVPARTSSFYFKGKQVTVADIAKALSVAHVLEGSVRKSGKHLRITAQLIRADNGYHLWSETYDRQLDDIFKVQDEIAGAVVKALKLSLMGSLPAPTGTQNVEAYNLDLQATSMGRRAHERVEYERAVEYARRAIDADPQFADAWATLSNTLAGEGKLLREEGSKGDGDQLIEEARRAAKQAIKLNPRLPDPHIAYAKILLYVDLDVRSAETQSQQALELDPNSQWALAMAGSLAMYRGQFGKGLELYQKSIAIDPVNPGRYSDLAWAYWLAGKYPEALAANRKMLDLDPSARKDYVELEAAVSLVKGDPAAALAEIESNKKVLEGHADVDLVLAYDALGRKAEADAALANLEKQHADDNACGIGMVYANRGQLDQAFGWFDRAYRQHEAGLLNMQIHPLTKNNVRSDPRFNALLRKLHLLD